LDFGDEGDIIADGDLPGPGSLELSAGNMAEEDGLRSEDVEASAGVDSAGWEADDGGDGHEEAGEDRRCKDG
jgi:hypothetical protein